MGRKLVVGVSMAAAAVSLGVGLVVAVKRRASKMLMQQFGSPSSLIEARVDIRAYVRRSAVIFDGSHLLMVLDVTGHEKFYLISLATASKRLQDLENAVGKNVRIKMRGPSGGVYTVVDFEVESAVE